MGLDTWLLFALRSLSGIGKADRCFIEFGLAAISCSPWSGVAGFGAFFGMIFVVDQ